MSLRARPAIIAVMAAILVAAVLSGAPNALASDDPVPRVPPGFLVTQYTNIGSAGTSLDFGTGPEGSERLYVTDFVNGRVLAFDHFGLAPGPPVEFASGFNNPLGVLATKNGTVFVADSESSRQGPFGNRVYGRVWRVRDTDGDGVADQQKVLLKDLPNGRHNTNGLAIGRDGMLYVANGNSTDDGVEGGDPEVVPWSGAVVRVDPKAKNVSLAALPPKRALVATGMRNLYDLAFSPGRKGDLFIPTNGVDDAREGSTGSNNPTEELENSDDLLYLTDTTNRRADDFGFPSCLYNEERQGNLRPYDNPNARTIEAFGPCDKKQITRPVESFGTHVSADGIAFQETDAWGEEYENDIFVAEFGNFFGSEPKGHRVVRIELDKTGRKVKRQSEFLSNAVSLDVTFDEAGDLYVLGFSGDIVRVSKVADLPATVDVQISGYQFLPQDLVIPERMTVRWVNQDALGLSHNVRAQSAATADGPRDGGEIDSSDLAVGKTHEFRFDDPGKWVYTCEVSAVHTALMHGSITVVPAGG